MKIAGLQKNSLVDYSGKVAAVVFTPGCNFDCFFCHNRVLLENPAVVTGYNTQDVLQLLENRKGFLDGVVVSGGEPTIQKGLKEFLRQVKVLGYPVKLDTNGSNPKVVEELVEEGLVDYIAMDFKAPYSRYGEICGAPVNTDIIRRSVELLIQGKAEYEFRTTVVPQLQPEDIMEIARSIEGARLYALQQYRPVKNRKDVVDLRCMKPPHGKQVLEEMARSVSGLVKKCIVRGIGSFS